MLLTCVWQTPRYESVILSVGLVTWFILSTGTHPSQGLLLTTPILLIMMCIPPVINYMHDKTKDMKKNQVKTYSFCEYVPSESLTTMLGRSLQSAPGATGMYLILAATRGFISLQIWS